MSERTRDPVADLRRIAFLLERAHESTYRVARSAARRRRCWPGSAELARRARPARSPAARRRRKTARVCRSRWPARCRGTCELEAEAPAPVATGGQAMRAALRGDCHTHSDWSDGGSPIEEMARDRARARPRVHGAHRPLPPAHGGQRADPADGCARQLDVVARLNEQLAPFRLLTGIEVDILEDGTLDQERGAAGPARRGRGQRALQAARGRRTR